MIISRTPFRISFFGGGTDYPAWYRQHGGAVLAATINKYCYLTCRYLPPFFEHRIRVVYSKIEMCQKPEEIAHPAVRAILGYLKLERGVEIHHDGDLPGRSGMGSSSAFTVGLLHALRGLQGQITGKYQLASESIHIEQDLLRETVGSQDQVCAAFGGVNQIRFLPSGEVSVQPLTLLPGRLRELSSHLMLFYTGIQRTASNIAASYVTSMDSKSALLTRMKDLVEQSSEILSSKADLTKFGELLHETWVAKRSLGDKISNSEVDGLYETARAAGALGGKLLGAGGGGFILLFVPPQKQEAVRKHLNKLIHVPFEFEFSGSQIIFFDPQEDYSEQERVRAAQQIQAFRDLPE
ncbi:MAG: kinase [Verrucomicrobia bacterium]|nr:kinase [Verrucomicrobiota bacterium]